ncbi:MAG: glycosyltransferase, partial [Oxalobacter sp.]|nr:glycosyltransferase [Oxalobacter sp.]
KIPPETRVLLGDSMGEMFMYYAACDITFIGGSLEKLGGQNLIEPCAVGKPVLIGPHTFNFEAITEDAIKAGAAVRIQSAKELMQQANSLLENEAKRQEMGQIASAFAAIQHGATERTIKVLAPLIRKQAT